MHQRTDMTRPLLVFAALLCSCRGETPDAADSTGSTGSTTASSSGTTVADTTSGTTTPEDESSGSDVAPPDFPPPNPPGSDACPGLSCLPCGNDEQCAADGEPFEGTCCAPGDALVHRAIGMASEAVDIESVDGVVFLCGGFGVRINDTAVLESPEYLGAITPRCQRIAIGPETENGRLFWLAHHGDTWVDTPFLGSYVLDPDEGPVELNLIEEPGVSFEGIAYAAGVLYAAIHEGGVRVYSVDGDVPVLETVLDGFDNATKVAVDDGVLYVADQTGGVRILDLTEPLAPVHLSQIELVGLARDVSVANGRLAVSLGADGVVVFDIEDPAIPLEIGRVDVEGSVQGVDIDDRVIAVAAWSHVALYDRDSLVLLATERVRPTPEFEQDLGISLDGDRVHVAEWEGHHILEYRPGYVAPDIWVEDELISFPADEPGLRVVAVRNRGYLDLDVSAIEVSETDPFFVSPAFGRIPAGGGLALEVGFEPEGIDVNLGTLRFDSNDPDDQQSPLWLPLHAAQSSGINVGDPIGSEFGFLDPSGNGQVEGLHGNVVVLAYFALF